jgi:hypothetical protein
MSKLWDWAFRVDLLQAWARTALPWLVPVVTGSIAAYLVSLEQLRPWQIFLGGLYGLAGGLLIVVGVVSLYQRVTRGKIERGLRPTVEMLEASAKAQHAKRETLIADWRAMVANIHIASHQTNDATVTALLEQHPSFLTYRPYMSEATKKSIYGRTIVVPPSQSTMSGTLHCILRDVDSLARAWRVE